VRIYVHLIDPAREVLAYICPRSSQGTSLWTSAHLRCSSSVNSVISTNEVFATNVYGDDIYFPIPRLPVTGILGGAGSYAALGARLFRRPPKSHKISWTVHLGSDFPDNLRQEIDSWETSCNFISTPERLTTQSLNIYGENEYRGITSSSVSQPHVLTA
jgi:hypothetical protein